MLYDGFYLVLPRFTEPSQGLVNKGTLKKTYKKKQDITIYSH